MHHVQQLINGEFSQSNTSEWINITDPATQDIIAKVPQSTDDEINEAVATAKAAFATWRKTPITTRARIFLKYQALIREHMDELAQILTAEQGKTLADARGDVFRGLEVVEHAAGIANLQIGDFVAPLVPIGLGAGRIGNFLNAELWGRTTDVPWAIIFPGAGEHPRHPSQLYEFALEGVLLFIILWLYSARPRPTGAVGGLFLLGYGCFRFIVEYFREPDQHIGLYSVGLSQGQLLCIPMIMLGAGLMVWAYLRKSPEPTIKNSDKKSA